MTTTSSLVCPSLVARLQTLSNCGDAIVLEATLGDDVNMVLDNTLWFDTITNSRIGIGLAGNFFGIK